MGCKGSKTQRIVPNEITKSWCDFGAESEVGGMEQMPDLAAQKKIEKMVQRIVERFHPEKIILFGSHARGTAGPDSDVDLLVVMHVQGSRRQKATEIDFSLSDREIPLDLLVVTPEQFDRDRDMIGTVIRPAAREGKVLYERAA